MRRIRLAAIALLIYLTVYGQGSTQSKLPVPSEQQQFSAEDKGVQRPVSIPDDVLAILAKDKFVQRTVEYERPIDGKLPASWFSASAIHLGGPDEIDLVILGEGPLGGANVITFWVFCATPHGYELVLTAPAHDLIVKNTRWKGYRQIEMSAETAVVFTSVLFRWDGRKYIEFREKSKQIR
jgi:hypothetical protein